MRTARDIEYGRLIDVDRTLQARRDALTRAAEDLRRRTERLSQLSACAAGAAKALNQAGVGDSAGLARTLTAVEAPCAAARGTP
jgi:hypothetical protein